MMNIVLDTNSLLMSLSKKGRYYNIWHSLREGKYVLCYTNDILEEYEEVLKQKLGKEIGENIINTILHLLNAKQIQIYYHWHLITADPDDNMFVDCAVAANAKYIVTQDHHYNALKEFDFPKVDVININEFMNILKIMDRQ